MTAELSIVYGLAVISGLFAWYSFKLRESAEDLLQKISLFLFFLSLVFLNLTMYAVFKIGQESLPYLVEGVLRTGLLVSMWATLSLVFILLLTIIWMLIMSLGSTFKGFGKEDYKDK